jgi:hypothetical protein
MNKKITLVFLMAAVLLSAVGCRKEGTTTTGPKKQAAAPQKGQPGATGSQTPATVGGQPPATAQQPARPGESNQPASARAGTPQGGVTTVSADVSTQAYIRQSERAIADMQQRMASLQAQTSNLKPEAQEKALQLQNRFQQDLSKASTALNSVRTASSQTLPGSKAAVDKALNDAAATGREYQAFLEAQAKGTN